MKSLLGGLMRSPRPEVDQEEPSAPPLEIEMEPVILDDLANISNEDNEGRMLSPTRTDAAEPREELLPSSSASRIQKEKSSELYPNVKEFFSGLLNRSPRPEYEEENPTAPPLSSDTTYNTSAQAGTASSQHTQQKQEGLSTSSLPYQKFEKEDKVRAWQQSMDMDGNFSTGFHRLRNDERCPVCFNAMLSSEDVVCQKGKTFHQSCFMKKHGPQCAHCCFPLTQADKDHELSGQYLVYKNKDYHVECYEKYAGPRCSHCFNVIIEKPNGEFSGQYVVDGMKEYHVECLQKKLHATWRAKNS